MSDADLAVVGAGPAGLATALYAARAGLRTVVFEPRAVPIDKACGEGVMPGAVRRLKALGVEVDGYQLRGIRYLNGRNSVDAEFTSGPGLGIRRTMLQAALVEAATREGVEFVSERVADIDVGSELVEVNGRQVGYVAVADGLHSPLRRRLGMDDESYGRRAAHRWGIRQHFDMPPWTDLVEVHWAADSEAYVTPVGPNLVGMAVLSSRQLPFVDQLDAFPALRERLVLPVASTTVRGAGPLRQRSTARVQGRVLLVGDAAGYVDALTGEGIAVSLACAQALVECVRADDPAAYERRWLAASRRYRSITSSLLWARRRSALAPLIVPAAARLPWVFRAAVQQLAHG